MTALAVAGLAAGAMSARADINMTLDSSGGAYTASVGLTSPDGKVLTAPGYDIGVYQFDVNSVDPTTGTATGLSAGSKFNSVCLSPSGDVSWGQPYNFTYVSLSGASPGLNPSGDWAYPNGANGQPSGIQNAAYLWNMFGSTLPGVLTIPAGYANAGEHIDSSDAGAGLSLAILEVLYDGGKAYGSINPSATSYAPNFTGDPLAQDAYNYYLAYFGINAGSGGLNGEAAVTKTYGIFLPDNTPDPSDPAAATAGQEFIYLTSYTGNIVGVPEPTTLVSAALLLLPFGASTLRVLRKKA